MGKSGKPIQCLGQLRPTKAPCTLARNGSGNPACCRKRCPKCKEQRCRAHCKCGRGGKATGRAGPRGYQGKGNGSNALLPIRKCAPARSARQVVEVLDQTTWQALAAQQISKASSYVTLASTMYDSDVIHAALLRRLRRQPACACTVLVDKQDHKNGVCKTQGAKLAALLGLGAKVLLGTGRKLPRRHGATGHSGIMHRKALLVDGRVAFAGGANATNQQDKNQELVFRFEGAVVKDIWDKVEDAKAAAEELKLMSRR